MDCPKCGAAMVQTVEGWECYDCDCFVEGDWDLEPIDD